MQSIPKTFNNKQLSHVWEYRDSDDKPLGYVARFDGNGKKEIIPYFKRINGHDWQSGSATEPRPLFGLDKSAKADSDRAIFIVEGEKVAAALQSLGLVAITSQGGSKTANKTDWTPLSGRRCVYLLPDNDQPGEEYIQTVAAILANLKMPPDLFVVRLPNLPLAGDAVNWIKAWFENAHIDWDCFQPVTACGIDIKPLLAEFKKTVKSHVEPVPDEWKIISGKGNLSGWQAPISLESAKLPACPSDVFPDSVQNFVIALSESTETPPEISAMMVLAVISAAAQGKYQVHVKADYSEPVNIWVCAALPPATRKTAVKTAATKPLVKWENSQRQEIEPEIKNAQADHATIQEKINQLRKKAANAKDLEFDKLKKEIADLESGLPEIPKVPQLWAQDITPENLGTVMADNKGRMAILSDEAGIFDIMGGRYSSGIPNLDLFLQGHAGSSTRVNRSSRPPVFMEAPALTMGLLPQPEVLRGLTEKPSFRGRGLLARMLYVMPSSNLGYRTLDASPIPPEYCDRYDEVITAILNHTMSTNSLSESCPHVLKLTNETLQVWKTFAKKVEIGMRDGGMFAHITDWAGKLPGAVIRIAALLHIVRHAIAKPGKKEISVDDMAAAIRMADVLSAHALVVFDYMGADPALDAARVVLRWIIREGKREFSFRDCHYAHKSRYKRATDLKPAIDVLIERHFIKPAQTERVAHRPSNIYAVNPAVMNGSL